MIGNIDTMDKHYVPKVLRLTTPNGHFIPSPGNIVLSNLRETVEWLANPHTNIAIKRSFRNSNPIPVAEWEDNLLVNPNVIIPARYGPEEIEQDLINYNSIIAFLGKKQPKFLTNNALSTNRSGTEAQFLTNSVSRMRVNDRLYNESIAEYCSRAGLEGDIGEFWSPERITGAHIIYGAASLPCEMPTRPEEWFPNYGDRIRERTAFNYNTMSLLAWSGKYKCQLPDAQPNRDLIRVFNLFLKMS